MEPTPQISREPPYYLTVILPGNKRPALGYARRVCGRPSGAVRIVDIRYQQLMIEFQ
jgi:hypothetical protein